MIMCFLSVYLAKKHASKRKIPYNTSRESWITETVIKNPELLYLYQICQHVFFLLGKDFFQPSSENTII